MADVMDKDIKDIELFEMIDKILSKEVDTEIINELDYWLDIVRKKSNALALSLKRCFENAKKSMRYVEAYKLGQKDSKSQNNVGAYCLTPSVEKYLEDHLKDYFEKNDFMHYREFVRLNRACAIEAGIEASSHIKKMYNDFFLGKRLVKAYELGRKTLSNL